MFTRPQFDGTSGVLKYVRRVKDTCENQGNKVTGVRASKTEENTQREVLPLGKDAFDPVSPSHGGGTIMSNRYCA
ncbi:hypothetical protein ANTPLA_LOCUS3283 [Anthophora plagiata]